MGPWCTYWMVSEWSCSDPILMTFFTFQSLGGRAVSFLGLQYLVSSQACAFICLQCALVSLRVTIRHVVSLGLVGGAGLVMFTCTAQCLIIFLDICKQNEPSAALEKWNHPGKVWPETTVLHNTGATEPMTADLHHSCRRPLSKVLGLQPSHHG